MWILVGLVPTICWGMQPLVISKIGGRPANQIIGTTLGTFLVSVLIILCCISVTANQHYQWWNSTVCLCAFGSGLAWCIGQILQYTAFKIMGVSKAMPLSTGCQLILINTISVILLHSWRDSNWPWQGIATGFASVVLIIIGVFLIAWKPKVTEMGFKQEKNRPKVKPWIIILIFIIGTIGYVGYFLLGQLPTSPYVFNIDPQTLFTNSGGSVETKDVAATLYGFDQFFPQASGMFLFASLFSIYIWLEPMFKKHPMTNLLSGDEKLLEPKIQRYGKISFKEANKFCPWKQSQSYYNMIDGIVFSAAALTILLSKAHNGSAIATTLSQTNIIIATLGGLLILHEKQQKKDLITTLLGMGLVVCGGVIIGLMPQMFLGLPG